MAAKKLIGAVIKIALAAVVLVYLALHTINFFTFTFPPEQYYLAWLGFGLTGGGLIGYLIVFLWDADSQLKKTVSLLMILVCGVGEVLAAGFGMQIEAWIKNGWVMTEQDFNTMLLAIRALAFAHFIALVIYVAGDKIGELFTRDEDKDGIPDFIDPIDNRTGQSFRRSYNSNVRRVPMSQAPKELRDVPYDINPEYMAKILEGQGYTVSKNGKGTTDPTDQPRR